MTPDKSVICIIVTNIELHDIFSKVVVDVVLD